MKNHLSKILVTCALLAVTTLSFGQTVSWSSCLPINPHEDIDNGPPHCVTDSGGAPSDECRGTKYVNGWACQGADIEQICIQKAAYGQKWTRYGYCEKVFVHTGTCNYSSAIWTLTSSVYMTSICMDTAGTGIGPIID